MKNIFLVTVILLIHLNVLPSPRSFSVQTAQNSKPSKYIDEIIINEIVNHYKDIYSKGSKMETENSDSVLTISFRNIPTEDNDFNGINISIYIPKIKSGYVFGDLNNDNVIDVLGDIFTEGGGAGGNIAWNDLFVFLKENGKYNLKVVSDSPSICGCSSGNFGPEKIVNGFILGHSTCWAEEDPHCCPTLNYNSIIKFEKSKLQFVDKNPTN